MEKKRTLNVVAAVGAIVAALAGFVLSALLNIFNTNGTPTTFVNEMMYVIQTLQNMGSFDPNNIMTLINAMLTVLVFTLTFISGLVLIVKLIVDVVNIKKEGFDKRAVSDSFKLSYTLLVFFGMLLFFTYIKAVDEFRTPEIGAYLGLGAGALAVCFSTFNYLITSEKPIVNKVIRVSLTAVAFVASVFALMPTIVYQGITMSPGFLFLLTLKGSMSGGMSPTALVGFLAIVAMFAVLVVASSFGNVVGNAAVSEVERKNAKKVVKNKNLQLVIFSVVAAILAAAAFFVVPLIDKSSGITLSMFAYVALGAMGLMIVLAIIVMVLAKTEEEAQKPQEVPQNENIEAEPQPEPAQEENVEEAPAEDNRGAQIAEAVIIADAVAEQAEKEEAQEEQQPEEAPVEEAPAEEAPVEEQKAEEAPAQEEKTEPAKKPAAKKAPEKKAAPAKKPAAKAEPKEKNTASYHLSKRASDNKWQVFRAGSDKVIKLFDTKAEAEEYTKRMAENQGVGYLSHASKGKNKGRIQKK